jgi:two-component system CheB/CheR fusion protein
MNGPQHDAWMTAIVNASSDAIISFTPNGTVLSWSCGAEAIFGYHADEGIGRSLSLLAPFEL